MTSENGKWFQIQYNLYANQLNYSIKQLQLKVINNFRLQKSNEKNSVYFLINCFNLQIKQVSSISFCLSFAGFSYILFLLWKCVYNK